MKYPRTLAGQRLVDAGPASAEDVVAIEEQAAAIETALLDRVRRALREEREAGRLDEKTYSHLARLAGSRL